MSAYIPQDLISNILFRLPVKTLLRFKCVSRQWHDLIEDPSFVEAHLRRSSVKLCNNKFIVSVESSKYYLEELKPVPECIHVAIQPFLDLEGAKSLVIGSCNGLLSALYPSRDVIFIVNVATRDYKEIPYTYHHYPGAHYKLDGLTKKNYNLDGGFGYNLVGGFGYDEVNDDYKVVLIETRTYTSRSVSMVYSMKNNTWSWSLTVPRATRFDDRGGYDISGVLVDGALHWSGSKRFTQKLICFDIETEEYGEIPLPAGMNKQHFHVAKWDGCLALICYDSDKDVFVDFWIMNNYRVESSWTKQYSTFFYSVPLARLDDGNFVILYRNPWSTYVTVYSYYPKSMSIESFDIESLEHGDHLFDDPLFDGNEFTYIQCFAESLVRLGATQPSKPAVRNKHPWTRRVLSQVMYF